MYSPPVDLSFKNLSNVAGSIFLKILKYKVDNEIVFTFKYISSINNYLSAPGGVSFLVGSIF